MGAWRIAEPVAGGLLFLFILADVFLTVLYARIGTRGMARLGSGFLSVRVGRVMRLALTFLSRHSPHRHGTLSFMGPVTLVSLIALWAIGLVVGTGLMIHPSLGDTVIAQGGATPTDFIAALYAAGTGLSMNGAGGFVPDGSAMRLLFLVTSIVGMFTVTLTVTYLLQVYDALRLRNNIAIDFHYYTDCTADAAELLVSIGRRSDFALNNNNLAELAEGVGQLREAHHFYPVIFFFVPANPIYGTARFLLLGYDTVTLMRTALSHDLCDRVGRCASAVKLWHACGTIAETLGGVFLDQVQRDKYRVSEEIAARWRVRFHAACMALRAASIPVVEDEAAAAERYIALRHEWQQRIEDLGLYLGLTREEIDPAVYKARA